MGKIGAALRAQIRNSNQKGPEIWSLDSVEMRIVRITVLR